MLDSNFSFGSRNFFYCHNYTNNPINITTHIHDCYEIFFFISGNVTYYIEGQAYSLKENDIIITNSRELHRIMLNSEEPFERKFIQFGPEYIAPLQIEGYNLLHYIENRKLGYFNKIDAFAAEEFGLYSNLELLEKHIKKEAPESPLMIKTILVQMLISINQILMSHGTLVVEAFENNNKVNSILNYINENYSQKITLDLLQDLFFINKYYLSHFFKKSTGFSVLEYTTYKRIMMAKELLDKKLPITDVAATVGFSDYSNFYKAFKKIVGMSPQKYK